MSYDALENSTDGGLKASLYLAEYGNGEDDYFAYTDFTSAITFQGRVYEPVSIGREPLKASGSLEQGPFTVDIAPNSGLAEYIGDRIPDHEIRLTIRVGHVDDPDGEYLPVWAGKITGAKRKDVFVELGCESVLAALRRPGLQRQYQRSCGWTLYEPQCNARRVVRSQAVPVIVGQNVIVLRNGWEAALDPEKYKGGYVSWDSGRPGSVSARTILDVNVHAQGHALLLQGDTFGLAAGAVVRVHAGCNRQPDDCKAIHDNILNFGGQPNIPTENPLAFTNRFY